MRKMHFGGGPLKLSCGASVLGIDEATHDLRRVSCTLCLWNLLAASMANQDIIANRIREVTNEEVNRLQLQAIGTVARG